MAIGERIRFFRNMKGITQKYLGMVVGFPERSADHPCFGLGVGEANLAQRRANLKRARASR